MAGKEDGKKSGRPGAKAVELFKEGKYEQAINELTKFLKTMPDDENKKVALYNRGMAHYNLGKYDMALKDGESCLKIDPSWVKGYKCKGLALAGLGRRNDAVDAFLSGQKMCGSVAEMTDALLNPLIERLNLKTGEETIKNEEKGKDERTEAKGVELFKKGKYKEAITQFTSYLRIEQDDRNKRVAHYNRGMARYYLGQYDSALADGEECLKIDPFWAKGYKCKGLALEGMGRPRDAAETFLDGKKMCCNHDPNTEAVLHELIKRLNRDTGFLGEDLDLYDRMAKEKYCVECNLFENDVGDSLEVDSGKKFISCDKCRMVNYCCRQHKQKDRVTHSEVCEELLMIRKISEEDYDIKFLPKEDALLLLVLKPRGPKGQQMIDIMKRLDHPPIFKNVIDYLGGVGDGNLMPLYQLAKFKPVTKTQQKELNTWNDLFAMIDKTTVGPASTEDIQRALTQILTDPMTLFYAMKRVNLLDNGDENKVIKLHIVGAEPAVEIPRIGIFINVTSNIICSKLHIVYIGPLLISAPGEVQNMSPAVALFRGTYQDYILSSDYKKPDCIVAFFPGLYDGTYNWLPAVVQAVAKKVPFLITCCGNEDHDKTKKWLMEGTHMKPEIVQDYLNPFCSWQAVQDVSGSNSISKRNMFSLFLMGGDLDALRPLLQTEDEKVELVQVLFTLQKNESMSDIMKLKKSGKI